MLTSTWSAEWHSKNTRRDCWKPNARPIPALPSFHLAVFLVSVHVRVVWKWGELDGAPSPLCSELSKGQRLSDLWKASLLVGREEDTNISCGKPCFYFHSSFFVMSHWHCEAKLTQGSTKISVIGDLPPSTGSVLVPPPSHTTHQALKLEGQKLPTNKDI